MTKSSERIMLLMAGMAAGAAIGIMFSPGKGSENRKKVKDQARKLMNKLHRDPRREKLEMVRAKLEKYRNQLDRHLEKINTRLNTPAQFENNYPVKSNA